jgi:hypothetical protein
VSLRPTHRPLLPETSRRMRCSGGSMRRGRASLGFASGLQKQALEALGAIDAKDSKALMDAGGAIDEACEACHVTYWYPNQKTPGS